MSMRRDTGVRVGRGMLRIHQRGVGLWQPDILFGRRQQEGRGVSEEMPWAQSTQNTQSTHGRWAWCYVLYG